MTTDIEAMKPSTLILIVAIGSAAGGCNRPDADHTLLSAELPSPTAGLPSAPAAPPLRGPVPPNANDVAPGTDASLVFDGGRVTTALKPPPSKQGSVASQKAHIEAQWAAARAPDTASADLAKRKVLEEWMAAAGSRDSAGNASGDALTRHEKVHAMPQPGQVNNYSTLAHDKPGSR